MNAMLVLILLATPAGGNTIAPGSVLPTESAPALNIIVLERGACYGACPIYRVSIDSSGAVSYDGERFVKVKGHRMTKVSPHVFTALANRFRNAQFDTLSVPKDCPEMATDHPTNLLSWTHDNQVHNVEHYTGNGCAPNVLGDLENAVDEATNTVVLVKCGHEACPQ